MHSIFFLAASDRRAEFDVEEEEGGAVSILGRFNPRHESFERGIYLSAEEAADAIQHLVDAHFEIDRLVRIFLHHEPVTISFPMLGRYAVPILFRDTGAR